MIDQDTAERMFSHVTQGASEEAVFRARLAFRSARAITLAAILGHVEIPQDVRSESVEALVRMAGDPQALW